MINQSNQERANYTAEVIQSRLWTLNSAENSAWSAIVPVLNSTQPEIPAHHGQMERVAMVRAGEALLEETIAQDITSIEIQTARANVIKARQEEQSDG